MPTRIATSNRVTGTESNRAIDPNGAAIRAGAESKIIINNKNGIALRRPKFKVHPFAGFLFGTITLGSFLQK
jgi:hypothetical protein